MSPNRTRGQSAGLTRQAVLRAALALADREGLEALSMRRIGRELGVEAMSLYQHVADKSDLLDGLVEQVFTRAAPPMAKGTSWREGLSEYAHALLRALLAHPNLLPLVITRPAITTQNLRTMENALMTLRSAGFTPERALDMLYAVADLVVGHAAVLAAGGPDEQAPTDRTRAAARPGSREAFPLTEAALARRSRGPESRFDFALGAMLRGFDPS
ncbi:TetR family transcriptional regulator [Glycomyces fuscus]|nr:TetR family transcriptional regulator [Glycomyces fuscus]